MMTENLYEPWPCIWCDEMVDFPAVVCDSPECQEKQRVAQEREAELRNKVDLK